jgi:hypothetical protein
LRRKTLAEFKTTIKNHHDDNKRKTSFHLAHCIAKHDDHEYNVTLVWCLKRKKKMKKKK